MEALTNKTYRHLNLEEREQLSVLRDQGLTFREIGKRLNRSHTSLSREYRKNSKYYRQYQPCLAQKKANRIALDQRTKAPLKNKEIYLYVRERLRMGWSPEVIAGRLPLDLPGLSIDDDTIYEYIYNSKKTRGDKLYRYLLHHHKRRKKLIGRKVKPEKIKNRLNIKQRPEDVNQRNTLGHWETDNMEGKRGDSVSVSATVERLTRYSIFSRLNDHSSLTKSEAIINRLNQFPAGTTKSITADNGPENSAHQSITKSLSIPVYFCNPYHSWEKGTVENTIGRLRRFFPKGESLNTISSEYLAKVESYLNHTPRKCLNFRTPYETMQLQIKKLGALQVRM